MPKLAQQCFLHCGEREREDLLIHNLGTKGMLASRLYSWPSKLPRRSEAIPHDSAWLVRLAKTFLP